MTNNIYKEDENSWGEQTTTMQNNHPRNQNKKKFKMTPQILLDRRLIIIQHYHIWEKIII